MSRSYLRDKYMKDWYEETSTGPRKLVGKDLFNLRPAPCKCTNKHRLDEKPKNSPSKLIMSRCKEDIEQLNRATYCSGHSTNKGRGIVSRLIRARLKRETQKILKEIENE